MILRGSRPQKRPLLEGGLILVAILWFAGVPLATSAANLFSPIESIDSWRSLAFLLAAGGLHLGGLLVAVALGKLLAGLERLFTIALVLALAAGWLLLSNLIKQLIPPPNPYEVNPLTAWAQLLVGVPYLALLGSWLVGRTHQQTIRQAWKELGLTRSGALGWGLGAAAMAITPWLITGALGDASESVVLLLQPLASGLITEWLWRGVILSLLLTVLPQRGPAVVLGGLLYLLYTAGENASVGLLAGLTQPLAALPLTFLMTELWLRPGEGSQSPWGGVIFHTLVLAAPQLLVDPRPRHLETGHVLATLAVPIITFGLALLMFVSRLIRPAIRDRWQTTRSFAAAAVAGCWGLALLAQFLWGVPGFANDGYLIILKEQADLSAVDRAEIYPVLVETAERTQKGVRHELDRMGLAYRPFYLVNMIRVENSSRGMSQLAQRDDVALVLRNPNVRRYAFHDSSSYPPALADEIPWGLDEVDADQVWELGITGRNIVVGGQDTGYDWNHPELMDSYRGWDGQQVDHNYNWYDVWDFSRVAFDDGSHGTHTMGTAVGNTVGMAPDAQWIGCRSMRYGVGNPGGYVECMEFLFAPFPIGGDPFKDGDPTLAAQVINNSWGCPEEEGCIGPEPIHTAVEVLRAAGIMMITSAGNDGPSCNTVWSPADEDAVFSIGASDELENIVAFSSRGPTGENLIKPDVVAPGVDVVSSVPDGRYGVSDGTSMASPHVTGLVALLWSANPALVGEIDQTEAIITQTAKTKTVVLLCNPEAGAVCACGSQKPDEVPNNVYGYGLIDALAAVQAALAWED